MNYQVASNSAVIETMSDAGGDLSLAARMPSPDIAAKIGLKKGTPQSLVYRMPSAAIAAKVGGREINGAGAPRRVRRLNLSH